MNLNAYIFIVLIVFIIIIFIQDLKFQKFKYFVFVTVKSKKQLGDFKWLIKIHRGFIEF